MRQSTRLVANAAAIYARMVLSVAMGLVTTRLALQLLGSADYGLQVALGAGGGLLMIISDTLTGSAQRHMAFEAGRGDSRRLAEVFNTTLPLFILAGLGLLVVGAAAGPSLIRVMVIPPERMDTAYWVFYSAVLSLACLVAATPFRAMLVAQQAILLASVFELLQSVLQLLAVVSLIAMRGDRLLSYSLLLLGVNVAVSFVCAGMVMRWYPEARPNLGLARRAELRHIAGFAIWGFLGSSSWRLFMQGSTIVLNVFFGPLANAAYAVAMQVNGYQFSLGQPITRAVEPAIVGMYARGDRSAVQRLTLAASRYQLLLALFYFVPVQLEVESLLAMWLKNPPPQSVVMVRWVLAWGLAMLLTTGHHMANAATGVVAKYMILMTVINCVAFVLPLLLFRFTGAGAWALPATAFAVCLVMNPLRAWLVGRQIGLGVWPWVRRVLLPAVPVGAAGTAAALTAHWAMDPGWPRLIAVTVAFALAAAPVTWLLGLDADDRAQFARIAGSLVGRFRATSAASIGVAR